jgi:hypothetical protein
MEPRTRARTASLEAAPQTTGLAAHRERTAAVRARLQSDEALHAHIVKKRKTSHTSTCTPADATHAHSLRDMHQLVRMNMAARERELREQEEQHVAHMHAVAAWREARPRLCRPPGWLQLTRKLARLPAEEALGFDDEDLMAALVACNSDPEAAMRLLRETH